jgi:hypothetical protein
VLVRTAAKARIRELEPAPDHVMFRALGVGGPELDWGEDGIRKTMLVRDGWVEGTFEHEFRGRRLLMLPVYWPLAALFVRIETRRFARRARPEDWTSHHEL